MQTHSTSLTNPGTCSATVANHQVQYLYDINYQVERYRANYSELQRIKNNLHYMNLRSRSRNLGEQRIFNKFGQDIDRLEKANRDIKAKLMREHSFSLDMYLEECKKKQCLSVGDYILQMSGVSPVQINSFIPVSGTVGTASTSSASDTPGAGDTTHMSSPPTTVSSATGVDDFDNDL